MLIFCWIAVPLLTVLAQTCMKLLATAWDGGLNWQGLLASPWVWGLLLCEAFSFVLWMRLLAVTPVGRALALTSISYLGILALGWFGFHEPMHPAQFIGSALILAGVWLLGTPAQPAVAEGA